MKMPWEMSIGKPKKVRTSVELLKVTRNVSWESEIEQFWMRKNSYRVQKSETSKIYLEDAIVVKKCTAFCDKR